jgi:hypothetical protein
MCSWTRGSGAAISRRNRKAMVHIRGEAWAYLGRVVTNDRNNEWFVLWDQGENAPSSSSSAVRSVAICFLLYKLCLMIVGWRLVSSSLGFEGDCRQVQQDATGSRWCVCKKEHRSRRDNGLLGVSSASAVLESLFGRASLGWQQGRSSMKGGSLLVLLLGWLPRSGRQGRKWWMQIAPLAGIRGCCLLFTRVKSRLVLCLC